MTCYTLASIIFYLLGTYLFLKFSKKNLFTKSTQIQTYDEIQPYSGIYPTQFFKLKMTTIIQDQLQHNVCQIISFFLKKNIFKIFSKIFKFPFQKKYFKYIF
jgi:hypothetical protein